MKIIITETQLKLITESIADDEEFLDYIKDVEGKVIDSKTGLHKAYKDSVGVVTIGYGHSENRDPNIKLGMKIPETKAISYLKSDLKNDEESVRSYVAEKFPGYKLGDKQLKMLVDFSYNPGLSKFPKFVKAVVTKDWDTAKKEYKRYAGGKELTDRNQKFYNLFLTDTVSQPKTTQPKKQESWIDAATNVVKKMANDLTTYTVKKGDSLSSIATKYGKTVDSIKKLNDLKTDKIIIGQKLKLK